MLQFYMFILLQSESRLYDSLRNNNKRKFFRYVIRIRGYNRRAFIVNI